MTQLDTFLAMRRRMRAFAESLSADQALRIPAGFNNNVAWNIGHIAVTQQLLCYKLSGVPLAVDEDFVADFGKGSAPGDWTRTPARDRVHALLTELAEQFIADVDAGRFETFEPYVTSAGIELESLEDAINFNAVHEGIHLGYCMALLRAS